jgi:hypothetical protein
LKLLAFIVGQLHHFGTGPCAAKIREMFAKRTEGWWTETFTRELHLRSVSKCRGCRHRDYSECRQNQQGTFSDHSMLSSK